MTSFYSYDELKTIGFKNIGSNVLISRHACIYGAENISIGNNVRIDDFCILSGKIKLENNIHISAYSSLFAGDYGITMEDYTTLSSRCVIYAITDDYSGSYMTNPMVPDNCRNVIGGPVILEKYVIVGTGSTILPNVTLNEGVAVGSMSLVNKSLNSWGIYVGIPCRRVKDRSKDLLQLELKFKESLI